MKPVMHGDLVAAARALLAAAPGARWRLARDLVARADAADRFLDRHGRVHPEWGNGTLMAAALVLPLAPEPRIDQPVYADCMILVLEALRARRLAGGALPLEDGPVEQRPGAGLAAGEFRERSPCCTGP
ncbi:hypothetical protein [Salipiger sp.]|uniref:DUF7742 family protein n=1 Tax=Salipiger sp. TaxID=2078585 RepID=UPI003A971BCC